MDILLLLAASLALICLTTPVLSRIIGPRWKPIGHYSAICLVTFQNAELYAQCMNPVIRKGTSEPLYETLPYQTLKDRRSLIIAELALKHLHLEKLQVDGYEVRLLAPQERDHILADLRQHRFMV